MKKGVIIMRYDGICDLVDSDEEAREYFNNLTNEVQQSLMAHGAGVNTLEEMKNFAEVIKEQN